MTILQSAQGLSPLRLAKPFTSMQRLPIALAKAYGGPNAYYIKQITDGKIDGVLLRNSPEQVGAIGPGMVWNRGSWFLYANGYLGH